MSKVERKKGRFRVQDVVGAKGKRKLTMITCYDYSFAKLIDQTKIDLVLVGDSLGNVMLGYPDTLQVTIEDMIHHSAAVNRGLSKPLLVVDLPFMSYQISAEQALHSAGRLVKEGGAQAVKLEGGSTVTSQIRAIVNAGIPVMGHLGLTPQSIHALGGYRVQGKEQAAAEQLIADAKAIEAAGAFALVLELVPGTLAEQVSKNISIPTIGIGAGPLCDGQVLVLQDLLGFDAEFTPKFLKTYSKLGVACVEAINAYCDDVDVGQYPGPEHTY